VIYSGHLQDFHSVAQARYGPAPEAEETISKRGKKAKKRAQKNGALAVFERPNARVRDYDTHVLICKGGDCKKRGAKTVRGALKDELRAQGMNRDVRIDCVDCLGLCKHGPNLIIYPNGTWYLGITENDIPKLVREHLKEGAPVEHLAAEFRPRKRTKS
jgi:(2Fe-2S) ferredoxin